MLLTHPAFQLYSATMFETVQQGIMQKVFLPAIIEDKQFRDVKNINESSVPIGLRWTMHPELGFPRKPFTIYRRLAKYDPASVLRPVYGANEEVDRHRHFYFSMEVFVIAVTYTIPAGQSMSITPLGRDNVLLQSKSATVTTSGSILFKAPFMIGLHCEGTGTVTNLAGVLMQSVINAKDWEKIQMVGFPFKKMEVGGLGYESDPQGFMSALTTGEEAAKMRLKMGEFLFMPPASINALDSQCNNVIWKHPHAENYLKMLKNEQLQYINKCLTVSDDFSFDRSKRQAAFKMMTTIDGINQPGSGITPQTATVSIPVVGHTILSVTNESPAALGLGFGTYDFVPLKLVNQNISAYSNLYNDKNMRAAASGNSNFFGFDYMVTAEYIVRPFNDFKFSFLDDLSKKVSFCALNDERTLPVSPAQLEVLGIQKNRPVAIDRPFTESVKLRWKQNFVSQGFGIVSNYKPIECSILNDPYDFDKDIYKNFFVPVPKVTATSQDIADIGKLVLTETDEPVPLFGSEQHKYFVAGWDVFGRWTPWAKKGYNTVAVPPQQPGIMSIRLNLADPDHMETLTPNQALVDAVLEIEFGWDWIDRSPSRIEIAGKFFNASLNTPTAGVPPNFSLAETDLSTPVIQINFSSINPNVLPTCSLGTITIVRQEPPGPPPSGQPKFGSSDIPSNNLKKYKLVIPNIKCGFPGVSPYEVAYTAFIRGLERVRVPVNEFSPWSSPYITRLPDPRPPAVTTLPATVLFTALPDATKLARGRLIWPAATGALAYHLWEASETAVRIILEPVLKTEFPVDETRWLKPLTEPLVSRATQLRDLLSQAKYINPCQRYFNRLTKDPIFKTQYELELPGSSEVMYLYQVSSVNSANIESGKSNVVFYAVPKIIQPGAPLLQVRTYKKRKPVDPDGEGFDIKVVTTIGEEPAGYHLYRTRKKIIGNDIGMKGLPVYEHNSVQWRDANIQMLNGTTFNGKGIWELGIERSWRPYVYQAVAIGKADALRGKISGESEPSTTEIVFFPPLMGPTLLLSNTNNNAFSRLFVFSTTAPFDKIDIGKTTIELYSLDENNKRSILATFFAHEIPRSATLLSMAGNAAQANGLPKMNYQPADPVSGTTQFCVVVKKSSAKIIVKIIDPLNRFTELQAGM